MAEHSIDADFDAGSYGLIELGGHKRLHAEALLFAYVILQALQDIGMFRPFHGRPDLWRDKNPQSLQYQAALKWLLYDRRDYYLICEMAGTNAETLRSQVQKFLLGKVRRGK